MPKISTKKKLKKAKKMEKRYNGFHSFWENMNSDTSKANLIFPVGKVGRNLLSLKIAKKYKKGSPIFMTAVLQYLTCELLELSGNIAK